MNRTLKRSENSLRLEQAVAHCDSLPDGAWSGGGELSDDSSNQDVEVQLLPGSSSTGIYEGPVHKDADEGYFRKFNNSLNLWLPQHLGVFLSERISVAKVVSGVSDGQTVELLVCFENIDDASRADLDVVSSYKSKFSRSMTVPSSHSYRGTLKRALTQHVSVGHNGVTTQEEFEAKESSRRIFIEKTLPKSTKNWPKRLPTKNLLKVRTRCPQTCVLERGQLVLFASPGAHLPDYTLAPAGGMICSAADLQLDQIIMLCTRSCFIPDHCALKSVCSDTVG